MSTPAGGPEDRPADVPTHVPADSPAEVVNPAAAASPGAEQEAAPGLARPPAMTGVDLTRSIESVLAPLQDEIDESRRQRESDRAYLAQRREKGLDDETKHLFEEAARSPQAPESLRRLAQQVAAGTLTWDQVFRGQGGTDGADFLSTAFATAAEHADQFQMTPVEIPEEARLDGADPEVVSAEADQDLAEATAAHDRIWADELLD